MVPVRSVSFWSVIDRQRRMSDGRGNDDGVGACGQLACQEAQSVCQYWCWFMVATGSLWSIVDRQRRCSVVGQGQSIDIALEVL